jgi:signal transduction histidine kinase
MAKMTVRARAVDMLGRQQIAGIPTAIHELFKNSYDAYAEHVEIDYFRKQNTLVLRDDGVGMTEDDFLSKWLTIGTESKLGDNRNQGYVPKKFIDRPRKIMGEKGIGRLAIAAIGRQVLIFTKAERKDGLHKLVVALVHWSFFEIPEIDISDIVIPVRTFSGDKFPEISDIQSMVAEITDSLNAIETCIPDDIHTTIMSDLSKLTFSPQQIFSSLKGTESLNGKGKGTHFIITAVDEVLNKDIDVEDYESASALKEVLVGFSNSMYDGVEAVLKTQFRDHKINSPVDEILQDSFFSPAEFDSADHHIDGEFDLYGQFKGKIGVYGNAPVEHKIQWKGNLGQPTSCGKFKIKFAYVQGESSGTKMPMDEYGILTAKLKKIGGIYIYKDGIRVLPYGKNDVDFLEIERRRTKKASTAFFSYRLIFGAIEITHDDNNNLIEKAGREGFKTNVAFRQFKEILINFLTQLAADFFRDTSEDSRWNEIKDKLNSEYKLEQKSLAKRQKAVKVKKELFTKKLNILFERIDKNYFTEREKEIKKIINDKLTVINKNMTLEEQFSAIVDLEKTSKALLIEFKENFQINKPNVGLNKNLAEDWESYLKNKTIINSELYEPLVFYREKLIADYIKENNLSIDKRIRIEQSLDEDKKLVTKNTKKIKDEFSSIVRQFDGAIKDKTREKSVELNQKIETVLADFNRTAIELLSDKEIAEKTHKWDNEIKAAYDEAEEFFLKFRDTIQTITEEVKDNELDSVDTVVALENQNEEYKARLDQYYEFAQLGMSIGIIQHEFGSTTKSVRQAIRNLKPWAESNPNLNELYKHISTSFQHLDGYLTLFTPLNRRLYRSKVELSGHEIRQYMDRVFSDRFKRHNIEFKYDDKFDQKIVETYPSVIIPVFINIIDNAIYWLNWHQIKSPTITLTTSNEGFIIANNGVGIEERYANRIFDFGYSLKNSGRGMGLYISKESLTREGFDLELLRSGLQSSPKFLVKLSNKEVE